MVEKVVRRVDGRVCSPILETLNLKRMRYPGSEDEASRVHLEDELPGRKPRVRDINGIYVPRRALLKVNRRADRAGLVIGDSTKVRGLGSQEINHVRVLISGGGHHIVLVVNDE